jgi:hypothetical protein
MRRALAAACLLFVCSRPAPPRPRRSCRRMPPARAFPHRTAPRRRPRSHAAPAHIRPGWLVPSKPSRANRETAQAAASSNAPAAWPPSGAHTRCLASAWPTRVPCKSCSKARSAFAARATLKRKSRAYGAFRPRKHRAHAQPSSRLSSSSFTHLPFTCAPG